METSQKFRLRSAIQQTPQIPLYYGLLGGTDNYELQGVHRVDIETIRERIREGNYLSKGHAIQHALKEGFDRKNMVETVLNGVIIEQYPDDQRMLICGRTTLFENTVIYLHVVCEYADPVYVEFVTAYIPDEDIWERPNFTRRRRKRR